MFKDKLHDEQGILLARIKHSFDTYDSAAKRYLSAVKELDNALDGIAASMRVLAQGEVDEEVSVATDSLCTAIDAHKSGRAESLAAQSEDPVSATGREYFFVMFMGDFNREVSSVVEELRTLVKEAEKHREKRDDAQKRYTKAQADVNRTEEKLAKRNESTTDNAKYTERTSKRDEQRVLAGAAEEEFNKSYETVMEKRSEALKRMVNAMSSYSGKYFARIAEVLRG